MGTNLFVEGRPSPIVLSVTLPGEAKSFRDVGEVARALADVDTTLRRDWYRTWPEFRHRRQREVWLLRFNVESPPFFEVLSDPAWLALFVVILTGYKQGKESVRELLHDSSRILEGVKGLSERQLELLEVAVRMTLERWLAQERKRVSRWKDVSVARGNV